MSQGFAIEEEDSKEDSNDADITGQVRAITAEARQEIKAAAEAWEECSDSASRILRRKIDRYLRDHNDSIPNRILIVEDNPNVALSYKRLLSQIGFVDIANDADEAYVLLRAHHYAVALVDLDLGETSATGVELIEDIRRISRPPTPTILISGAPGIVQQDLEDLSVHCGAHGWLLKPVQSEVLLDRVGRLIPRARQT